MSKGTLKADDVLVSLRTVSTLIKQSCGLFSAMTAAAMLRGLLSRKNKKYPCMSKGTLKDDDVLVSLRTVSALRKQSCGLFSAMTAAAMLRGLLSRKNKKYLCMSKGTLKADNELISCIFPDNGI